MKPELDPKTLSDAAAFDLLMRPEAWPDDPAAQAEFAELLELHLALQSHKHSMNLERKPRHGAGSWWRAAAAAAAVLLPSLYTVKHVQTLKARSQNIARIDQEASKRAQDRLWAGFFQQTSELLKNFEKHPELCALDKENREREREAAVSLLLASHQLASQGAPVPEAEAIRTDLHAWLSELALEDGCLNPQRASELRRWAKDNNLEGQAERMGRLLRKETA
ncbi:MAG: hypothetical protein KGN80_06360 [Acidobacteriota bacterium]|nr:hypothetical protein [Acidobacteriota bacterium]